MYNQKQKSNVHLRKKHKTADRKGGGGGQPLTVSLTVKNPFFFDDFPKMEVVNGQKPMSGGLCGKCSEAC